MQFNKKISKAGGVTLPSALRRAVGIEAGEKFSVQLHKGVASFVKQRLPLYRIMVALFVSPA